MGTRRKQQTQLELHNSKIPLLPITKTRHSSAPKTLGNSALKFIGANLFLQNGMYSLLLSFSAAGLYA